jgi:hypothetical protein
MDFYDILELAELKAIESAISPTMETIWRMRARDYSQKFFTPLHIVLNELNPMMVLQALYEDKYPPSIVKDELEELLEYLYKIKDPTYEKMSKEDVENLVDAVINKENSRKTRNKKLTPENIEAEIKTQEVKKTFPKSGSMSFDNLNDLESTFENKTGFKD